MPRTSLSVALICVSVVVSGLTHELAYRSQRNHSTVQAEPHFPDGTALRKLVSGYAVALADLYWLRFIQYVGTPETQQAGLPHGLGYVELITDLDPLYGYAYQTGGVVLSGVGRTDESNRILKKGVANVPDRWQLPFYLAFNHWYSLGNFEEGARWLEQAAKVADHPRHIDDLIARLYSTAGRTDKAIAFIEAALSESIDPATRSSLEQRLLHLVVERDLQLIEDAVTTFRLSTGVTPSHLAELVPEFVLKLPNHPSGESYHFDPATGVVRSPIGEKRVTLPEGALPNASLVQ